MRVLIIDDEPFARDELAFLLGAHSQVEVVGFAQDGVSAGEQIHALAPDVVFCDIEMPGLGGIELARMFRAHQSIWVFVTAYDHHALSAFDVQASDYLVKPVDPERLAACIQRLQARLEPQTTTEVRQRLTGKIGQRLLVVARQDIRYVYSDGVAVNIVAQQTSHSDLSLKALIEQAGLVQCHRQFGVNIDHINELRLLPNGNAEAVIGSEQVPVSRRYLPQLKHALGLD